MREWVLIAVTYLFVAAATAAVAKKELEIGNKLDLLVQTIPHKVDGCFVKTPQNLTIEFKPNDYSDKSKYKLLQDNLLTACQVELTVTDNEDNGHWSIYFIENESIVDASEYDITVKSSEAVETEHTQGTTWLKPIEYVVTKDMTVEISVRKIDGVYDCSLFTPTHNFIREDEEHVGVKFFKTNSDIFTSCRVQIGPIIDEDLLGDWHLCSQRLIDNELTQDCQSASISWNENNPNSYWSKEQQPQFDHPVHFGGNLPLTVQHSGNIKSCHVITPFGNDLTVQEDSDFPYVTRTSPFTECNVVIGPIDAECLGDWTVYGIFTSFTGVQVVQLPTTFSLYNEQNPHDQAYNVTKPEPIVKISNQINIIDFEVSGKGKVDNCDITPPEHADIENDVISIENSDSCKYSVGPVTNNMLGDWLVTGKFSNGDLRTEIRQVFTIKNEDPYNPEEDEKRIVKYLEPIHFDTSLGNTHEVVISGDQHFKIVESCHVRLPDGRQYSVIEGFHVAGVEAERGTDCVLRIHVNSKDMVGEWSLIARKSDYNIPVEERLNFNINVEEQVPAVPSQVYIYEHKDLSIRLRNSTEFYETCKLYGPDGGEYLDFEVNVEYYEYCALIVRNVNETMNGTWQIVYEDGVVFKAYIDVVILRDGPINFPDLFWVLDDQVDQYIGPENVSYCQILDPTGVVVFDGFGQCKIMLSRVTYVHDGRWTVEVGHKGKIIMVTYWFTVKVEEPSEYRPTVYAHVETKATTVYLSCSVETYLRVQLCKFRGPQGYVFIASQGVAQDRYMVTGSGIFNDIGVYHHECGIRISDVTAKDNGIWRCAINTVNDTFYGFLPVKADAVSPIPVPTLISFMESVVAVVGDELRMSCNIPTSIKYCYFRKENGTVYNLVPGISADVEYLGAGFDAGECGIKFKTKSVRDSGKWTCNVGVYDTSTEQRDEINVKVYDELSLKHYMSGYVMVVNATAMQHYDSDYPRVDYCRYVRADGLSFTTEAVPFNYISARIRGSSCLLVVSQLTTADYYPWTVTMKMKGRMRELTGVTAMDVSYYYYYWNSAAMWLWFSITCIGIFLIVLGFSFGPKKNRDWGFNQARNIRNSIRSSFRSRTIKAPLALPSIIDQKPPAYSVE